MQFKKVILADEGKHRRVMLRINLNEDPIEMKDESKILEFSILLKLKSEEDYFTLINKAKIDFNKIKSEQEKI